MGNHIKKSTIIDFYGLPGSGKSSVSHLLVKQLKKEGFSVQENIYKANNRYPAIVRVIQKFIATLVFSINNYMYMLNLFQIVGQKNFKNYYELIKQWVNISFVLINTNKTKNKDFIIADQGIIQAALSLTKDENKVLIIINELLKKVNTEILFIHISVELLTSLDRLETRKNGRSRIEKEKNREDRLNKLEIEKKLLNLISKNVDAIVIINEEDILGAVLTLENEIMKCRFLEGD